MSSFRPHRALGLLLLVLTVACGGAGQQPDAPAAAATESEPEASPRIHPGILDHPQRSDDDRFRDAGFRPLEVYEFFDIAPGMTVADMMPGGGYNTVLLSQIVGAEGRVIAVLGGRPEDPERSTRRQEMLQGRLEPFGLDNLEVVPDPTRLESASVDLLLTVRNYHDLGLREDRLAALPEYLRVLAPGGIFAVIDAHTDKTDERDESVHRINGDLAREEIASAGFEFVDASDVLSNPDDTYDFDGRERAGFRGATENAPIHRYYVHRWVHKYRKPTR